VLSLFLLRTVAGFACGNLLGAKTAFAFCGVCGGNLGLVIQQLCAFGLRLCFLFGAVCWLFGACEVGLGFSSHLGGCFVGGVVLVLGCRSGSCLRLLSWVCFFLVGASCFVSGVGLGGAGASLCGALVV